MIALMVSTQLLIARKTNDKQLNHVCNIETHRRFEVKVVGRMVHIVADVSPETHNFISILRLLLFQNAHVSG